MKRQRAGLRPLRVEYYVRPRGIQPLDMFRKAQLVDERWFEWFVAFAIRDRAQRAK